MRFTRFIAAAASAVLMAGLLTACSAPEETAVTPPDYTEITTMIQNYEDSYREYVQTAEGNVMVVRGDGYTPLGVSCSFKYLCTDDGVYESCSLIVHREFDQYDEYFNLNADYMMFTRYYIESDGEIFLNKYICTSDAVYLVNYDNQTLDRVDDVTGLDCFVTFDQVRRVYGMPADTEESAEDNASV